MELLGALPAPATISPPRASCSSSQSPILKQESPQLEHHSRTGTRLAIAKNSDINSMVIEIASILKNSSSTATITHEQLKQSLTPYEKAGFPHSSVVQILLEVRDPEAGLGFLLWAKNVAGYKPGIIVWNNLLGLFVKAGKTQHLRKILEENNVESSSWNEFTYGWIMHSHCSSGEFDLASQLIESFRRSGIQNQNTLLVLHNMMIKGLSEAGLISQAQKYLEEMDSEPNLISYNTILVALCKDDERVEEAHSLLLSTKILAKSVQSFNMVVAGYSKAGKVDQALDLVEQMSSFGVSPNLGSFNAIVEPLCKSGKPEQACKIVEKMMLERSIVPNIATLNTILLAFCKSRKPEEARAMVEIILELGLSPTIITYNSLLELFLREDLIEMAMELLETMGREGCKPSFITYKIILEKALAIGGISQAQALMNQIISSGYHLTLNSCHEFISGLCRAGELDSALKFLEEMPGARCEPRLSTYNLMIGEFCKIEKIQEAERVLEVMIEKGFTPDEETYSVLIRGLCEAGRVEQAYEIMEKLVEAKVAPSAGIVSLIEKLCEEKEVEKAAWILSRIPQDQEALGVCKSLIQQTRNV